MKTLMIAAALATLWGLSSGGDGVTDGDLSQAPFDRLPDGTMLPDNCVNMGNGLIREYQKGYPQDNKYNLYRIEE